MSDWPSRFAGAVLRGQTWLNLAYLLLAFPTGLVYFIVLVVGISLGVALAILVVGLGILLATLAAWRGMAAVEQLVGIVPQCLRDLHLAARRGVILAHGGVSHGA